jgi:deazaflavin-dependent oxidoreductase (nitroreductase family)
MPLPQRLARFNRFVTNRLSRPLAARLSGFAVIRHRGRVTGRTYETPVNIWKRDGALVVALTYGRDVDWLKNTEAAGQATLVMGGIETEVRGPNTLSRDQGMASTPWMVGHVLNVLGVSDFVEFVPVSRSS